MDNQTPMIPNRSPYPYPGMMPVQPMPLPTPAPMPPQGMMPMQGMQGMYGMQCPMMQGMAWRCPIMRCMCMMQAPMQMMPNQMGAMPCPGQMPSNKMPMPCPGQMPENKMPMPCPGQMPENKMPMPPQQMPVTKPPESNMPNNRY